MAAPPSLSVDTVPEGDHAPSSQSNPSKKHNSNPNPTNKSSPGPSPNKKPSPQSTPSSKHSTTPNSHSTPNPKQNTKHNPHLYPNSNQTPHTRTNPNPNSSPKPLPNPNPKLSFALSIPAPPPAAVASSSSSSTFTYNRSLPSQNLSSPSPSSSSAATGSPHFFTKSAMVLEEGRRKGAGGEEKQGKTREEEEGSEEGNEGEKQRTRRGKPIAGDSLKTSGIPYHNNAEKEGELQKKKKKTHTETIAKDTKDSENGYELDESVFKRVTKLGQNAVTMPSKPSPSVMRSELVSSMTDRIRVCVKGLAHFTEFNPNDAWLPITTDCSRNSGRAILYSSYHSLSAGIGFQGLLLPFAMFYLGWYWGIIALTVAYIWQLYTMWILIRLHESNPGLRYSRYVQLSQAAFGDRLGFWLATPPTINLTVGTSTTLIIIGGSTLKLFYKIVCGPGCGESPLSTIEWYLVFALLSMVLTQLPNLNSIVGLSLLGVVSAITYCVLLWVLSITRTRPSKVSYGAEVVHASMASIFTILNALGIIAFSFRGHSNVMEIQATMPSSLKHPAYLPMWRGAKVANTVIALCYFPIAVGGYWAYGRMMLSSGILSSVYAFHQSDISRTLMGLLFLLVVINCLTGFQTNSYSIFDNFEAGYTAKCSRPISKHARVVFRIFYVLTNLLIGVAFPWLSGLTGLLGGLTSAPITFAYPCFMWLAIKKPKQYSFSWYLNWTLGVVGMSMAVAFAAGGIWSIVTAGLTLHFFRAS